MINYFPYFFQVKKDFFMHMFASLFYMIAF
jgi:hypothetical protein